MSGYSSERRLLQIVSRGSKAIIVLIEVNVDETGTDPGDVATCVAAYVIKPGHAERMIDRWERVLRRNGLAFFHMTDCAHYQVCEPYKSLGRDRCIRLATELIRLIKKHCARGVAQCFNPRFYTMLANEPAAEMGSGYGFAISGLVYYLQRMAEQFGGDVSYVFEAGHRDESKARAILDILLQRQKDAGKPPFAYTFQTKTQATLLQAADILAWHCQSQIKRNLRGLGTRKDFLSLLKIPHDMFHIANGMGEDGKPIPTLNAIYRVQSHEVDQADTLEEMRLIYDFGYVPVNRDG